MLKVTRDNQTRATASVSVIRASPGLFSADASGTGLAAAIVTILRPDGSRSIQFAARYDELSQRFVPIPVDLSSGEAILSLYGTGWRGGGPVSATIGGVDAVVLFAGAQSEFPGLDQMNLRIPPEAAGRGLIDILVRADGRTANPLRIEVR